jgi:hypothetical protein
MFPTCSLLLLVTVVTVLVDCWTAQVGDGHLVSGTSHTDFATVTDDLNIASIQA